MELFNLQAGKNMFNLKYAAMIMGVALTTIASINVALAHGDTIENHDGMVAVQVLFPTGDASKDVDGFIKKMASTASKYEGMDGLKAKYYVLSGDNNKAGGIYIWESLAKANAWYTPKWYDYIKKAYGEAPEVTYMKVPVIVEN